MRSILKSLLIFIAISLNSFTQDNFIDLTVFDPDNRQPLTFEQAFDFQTSIEGDEVTLKVYTEKDHYLYKEQFRFSVDDGSISEEILWSDAKLKEDEYMGLTPVFEGEAFAKFKVHSVENTTLHVTTQGCSSEGICYIPQKMKFKLVNLPNSKATVQKAEFGGIYSFILIGLLIALTPCTFPLISIVIGAFEGNKFTCAIAYTHGMAMTFVGIGMTTTATGSIVLPYLNNIYFYLALSALFFYIAHRMYVNKGVAFGASTSQKVEKLTQFSNSPTIKAFIVGAASGVLATPCTAAPLLAVFTHISVEGNLAYSAWVLYAVTVGISIPMIAIAVAGKRLLLKPGKWMESIKTFIAVLIALYPAILIAPLDKNIAFIYLVVADILILMLWGRFALGYFVAGTLLIAPLVANETQPPTTNVITESIPSGTYVMKIQADWCASCRENNETIKKTDKLSVEFKTLDITSIEDFEKEHINRHNVLGVPLLQFIKDGNVIDTLSGQYTPEELTKWVTKNQLQSSY